MDKYAESTGTEPPPYSPAVGGVQPQPMMLGGVQPQPMMYGQPGVQPAYPQQQMYIQQPYPQAGYVPQPVGHTTIIVAQPAARAEPRTDWTMPKAKCPGILTIIVAILNLVAFIGIGVTSVFYSEFCFAFVLYLVVGVLGVVGAQQQRSRGVAIACLVLACITLIMAFAQIILRGLAITFGQLLVIRGHHELGQITIWVNVAILIVCLLAFALSIALIVIPSNLLCCGRQNQQPGVVYATGAPAQGVVVAQ